MNEDELCARGEALLAAGSASEAARCFRSAIERNFDNADAHHGLLRALCASGRARQAVDVGLALIVLTPGESRAHAALSEALQQAGLTEASKKAAQRARQLALGGAEPADCGVEPG